MQIYGIYSVYDRKAQTYLPLFQETRDELAVRTFTKIILTTETPISEYPADFDLVRLGAWNSDTGSIEPEIPMGLIINGLVALEAAIRERSRYDHIRNIASEKNPSEDIPEAS